MPTIAEQSDAIHRDLVRLRERDAAHAVPGMLAQWSAELSILFRCQVVVLLVPLPGRPTESAVIAYPLLTQSAIDDPRNRAALATPNQGETQKEGNGC